MPGATARHTIFPSTQFPNSVPSDEHIIVVLVLEQLAPEGTAGELSEVDRLAALDPSPDGTARTLPLDALTPAPLVAVDVGNVAPGMAAEVVLFDESKGVEEAVAILLTDDALADPALAAEVGTALAEPDARIFVATGFAGALFGADVAVADLTAPLLP